LEHFRIKHKLDGLAYFYNGAEGSEHRMLASSLILGNSMLIARGIPMCGEYDIKTCLAMYIMDSIGIGGSFAEIHPFDTCDDVVLIGHDGPHNIAISEGKPRLRKLKKYHGKSGSGIGVEFSLKSGPITMLSISVDRNGKFRMIAAEGESLAGEIPQTGNTNTRVSFGGVPVCDFLARWCEAGPTHHFAAGTGRHIDTILKVAKILDVPVEVVCR
jgi:L-arabinose isomerase